MIIAVDVDGVIIDTISEILRRYNHDYNDHLTCVEILEWDVSKFVKPVCGKEIFSYFEVPDVYRSALPIENAHIGICALRAMNHRVIFVTTAAPGTYGVKQGILTERGYLQDGKDYIECADKSLIRADVLVDDGIHNLRAFRGEHIIFDQPWNTNDSISGAWRAHSWLQVVRIIEAIGH